MAQHVTATSPLLVIPVGADLLVEVANSVSFVTVSVYSVLAFSHAVAQWGAMVGRADLVCT